MQYGTNKSVTKTTSGVGHHIALRRPSSSVQLTLRDVTIFTLGVFFVIISEGILLLHPEHFYLWYSSSLLPLLIWRYFSYTAIKEQYFMLDYCYAVNALVLCHLFVFTESVVLFRVRSNIRKRMQECQ
jgi:hypothetical protein